jgi:hypothetical protein
LIFIIMQNMSNQFQDDSISHGIRGTLQEVSPRALPSVRTSAEEDSEVSRLRQGATKYGGKGDKKHLGMSVPSSVSFCVCVSLDWHLCCYPRLHLETVIIHHLSSLLSRLCWVMTIQVDSPTETNKACPTTSSTIC